MRFLLCVILCFVATLFIAPSTVFGEVNVNFANLFQGVNLNTASEPQCPQGPCPTKERVEELEAVLGQIDYNAYDANGVPLPYAQLPAVVTSAVADSFTWQFYGPEAYKGGDNSFKSYWDKYCSVFADWDIDWNYPELSSTKFFSDDGSGTSMSVFKALIKPKGSQSDRVVAPMIFKGTKDANGKFAKFEGHFDAAFGK